MIDVAKIIALIIALAAMLMVGLLDADDRRYTIQAISVLALSAITMILAASIL